MIILQKTLTLFLNLRYQYFIIDFYVLPPISTTKPDCDSALEPDPTKTYRQLSQQRAHRHCKITHRLRKNSGAKLRISGDEGLR